MSNWTPICRLEDIPLLGSRRVAREKGLDVALFRTEDDKVYALLDRCAHKGGPLSQGIVFGQSVACPLHNWTFSLSEGVAAAPDEGHVPTFAVKVQDEQVWLDADELASHAIEQKRPLAGPVLRCGQAA